MKSPQYAAGLQTAQRHLAEGRLAAAREACGEVLAQCPDELDALHVLGLIAVREGHGPQAEAHLKQAAESPHARPRHLLSYAELCRRAEDPAAAIALTRRALAMDESWVLAWYALGNQSLQARDYIESRRCLERALSLDPSFWPARAQLAFVDARTGDRRVGMERFRLLLREQGGAAEVVAHYAAFLQELGALEEALLAIEFALQNAPGVLEHTLRAADLELQREQPHAALRRLRAARERHGDEPRFLIYLAQALLQTDRSDAAVDVCRRAAARGIQCVDLSRVYARALMAAGAPEEALQELERGAAPSAPILTEQGVLLGRMGRLDEAHAAFDAALALDPASAEAWYHRTDVASHHATDPALAAMQRLLERGAAQREALLLHFALGKAHRDAGSLDQAFAHWHQGNRLKRALIDYDADGADAVLARRCEPEPKQDLHDLGIAQRSELPVFIIGMPRSGSSLVEHILAAHPQVHGGGEQMGLRRVFEGREDLGFEARCANDAALAAKALALLQRRASDVARVIDKDLRNFLHVGAIRRLFPHARIIHCRRDPLDTCYSIYTKLFAGDLPFAYEQRELARYYRGYAALMAHWRATLPGAFLDLDYETLVSAPEPTIRCLLDFVGLPWHAACLDFARSPRAVHTASFAQVRRPLYASSVGAGHAVRRHLQGLVNGLNA